MNVIQGALAIDSSEFPANEPPTPDEPLISNQLIHLFQAPSTHHGRPQAAAHQSQMNRQVLIETNRLYICPLHLSDAEDAFEVYGDRDVMRFVEGAIPLANLAAMVESLAREISNHKKYGFGLWAVVAKDTEHLIGLCGFQMYKGGPALELAYHFAKKHWGKGYASEAAAACLDYGIRVLSAPRVVASVHPDNTPSRHILEKIGLRYTHFEDGENVFEVTSEGHFSRCSRNLSSVG